MAQLRAELARAIPFAVQRLLTDRAVLCWFHVHQLELTYAGKESMPLALAQHYQKCIDHTHRRDLPSSQALAEIRKLNVTFQLYVAHRQVYVGYTVAGSWLARRSAPTTHTAAVVRAGRT